MMSSTARGLGNSLHSCITHPKTLRPPACMRYTLRLLRTTVHLSERTVLTFTPNSSHNVSSIIEGTPRDIPHVPLSPSVTNATPHHLTMQGTTRSSTRKDSPFSFFMNHQLSPLSAAQSPMYPSGNRHEGTKRFRGSPDYSPANFINMLPFSFTPNGK